MHLCITNKHSYAENVTAHPEDGKYRKLKLTNPTFAELVWCNEEAKMLLLQNGWRADLRQGWLVLDSSHVTGAALAEAAAAAAAVTLAFQATVPATQVPPSGTPQAQTPEPEDNTLEVGCRVVIYGLEQEPELNGVEGVVEAEVKEKGQWQVKAVVRGEMKMCLLKPSCLALLATAADEAVATLLATTPPAVQYWLDGGAASEDVCHLGRKATEWLVKIVQNAHLSPELKKAGRDLMACSKFTHNIDPLECWNQILIPKLNATLVAHGETAKQANAACNLATELTEEAILKIASFNATLVSRTDGGGGGGGSSSISAAVAATTTIPHRRPRDDVRQDELMKALTNAVSTNFERDWKQLPEHVYIHILLLIGVALDPLFGDDLDKGTSDLDGVKLHEAPIKSFIRMRNKLRSRDDHLRVKQRPRPAMNIDVVRRLASAKTPADVRELVKLVSETFGGLSYLKCLPELATTDPAAADARFHMLPVMLTVVFAPEGLTVGGLLADKKVRAKWAAMRATRPAEGVSLEEWQADHDAAIAAMMRCDPVEPVKMHCEVQVVTEAMGEIRHKMHEVYKVVRADDGAQLYADVAKPGREVDYGRNLVEVAMLGRLTTVKRLLSGGSGGGGSVYASQQRRGDGATALYCAAQNGHLSIVLVLLEHNANPDIARSIDGATPIFVAARKGHVEVATLLLEHNADPKQTMSINGTSPVSIAAGFGHVEVVALLLEHNADPNEARTDDGVTPMYLAATKGHVEVVALLLTHYADPNKAATDDGVTPIYIAAMEGHVEVATLLLKHNADPNRKDDSGQTPLDCAIHFGHTAIVDMLRAAGATE